MPRRHKTQILRLDPDLQHFKWRCSCGAQSLAILYRDRAESAAKNHEAKH